LKLISAIEDFTLKYLANRPVVKNDDSGGWRGIFDGPNIEVYRKIAYAEAPVDDLRFRLPMEKKNLSKISNSEVKSRFKLIQNNLGICCLRPVQCAGAIRNTE